MNRISITPKVSLALVLAFLSLVAVTSYHTPLLALTSFILIMATSVISDYAVGYYRKIAIGKPITAIIIAEILFLTASPSSSIFQIFLAVVTAIAAKHYLARRGRGIFNAAALGLFVGSFFGLSITWWGLLPGIIFSSLIILSTGYVSILKLRQELIIIPFVLVVFGISFFLTANIFLTYTQLLIGGFWFFAMVMLPDVKSTPSSSKLKIAYGAFVAVLSFLNPKLGIGTEPLITSLLIGNITFWYIEKGLIQKMDKIAKKLPLASKLVTPE